VSSRKDWQTAVPKTGRTFGGLGGHLARIAGFMHRVMAGSGCPPVRYLRPLLSTLRESAHMDHATARHESGTDDGPASQAHVLAFAGCGKRGGRAVDHSRENAAPSAPIVWCESSCR
jgi:hypothetical protein